MVSKEVLTAKNMTDCLLHGPNADRVADIMVRRIGEGMDEFIKLVLPLINLTMGEGMYEEMKREATDMILETVPATFAHGEEYLEDCGGISQEGDTFGMIACRIAFATLLVAAQEALEEIIQEQEELAA